VGTTEGEEGGYLDVGLGIMLLVGRSTFVRLWGGRRGGYFEHVQEGCFAGVVEAEEE
jgi:hypothetical protein